MTQILDESGEQYQGKLPGRPPGAGTTKQPKIQIIHTCGKNPGEPTQAWWRECNCKHKHNWKMGLPGFYTCGICGKQTIAKHMRKDS